MEKAMHGAHGIGYERYRRDNEKRIEVEQKREEEYQESRKVAMNINGNISTGK